MAISMATFILGLATTSVSTRLSSSDRSAVTSRLSVLRSSDLLITMLRYSGSNGFVMKSVAPSFMASTARGIDPNPVMTIAGRSGHSFRTRLRTSMPFSFGSGS